MAECITFYFEPSRFEEVAHHLVGAGNGPLNGLQHASRLCRTTGTLEVWTSSSEAVCRALDARRGRLISCQKPPRKTMGQRTARLNALRKAKSTRKRMIDVARFDQLPEIEAAWSTLLREFSSQLEGCDMNLLLPNRPLSLELEFHCGKQMEAFISQLPHPVQNGIMVRIGSDSGPTGVRPSA